MKIVSNLPDQISLHDIQRLLTLFEDEQPNPVLSCLELAKQHNLVGTLENAPPDLSYNSNSLSLQERKRKFFEHLEQHRFVLPDDYYFDREELYAKNPD